MSPGEAWDAAIEAAARMVEERSRRLKAYAVDAKLTAAELRRELKTHGREPS